MTAGRDFWLERAGGKWLLVVNYPVHHDTLWAYDLPDVTSECQDGRPSARHRTPTLPPKPPMPEPPDELDLLRDKKREDKKP